MLLFISTIATTLALAHAELGRIDIRKLSPSDAGAYHTEGFEQLAERYSTKKPENPMELALDASEIAASFCPEGDHLCTANAYKATLNQFQSQGEPTEINYPSDFDDRIKSAMDETNTVIKSSVDRDVDDVVEELTQIQDKIEDMSDVNTSHQVVGLSAVSVAIESTKLWHQVYNDESHPLHSMLDDRRLQYSVVSADFEAAVNAGLNAVNEDVLVLAVWPGIILAVVPAAYAASIRAAFLGGNTYWRPIEPPY